MKTRHNTIVPRNPYVLAAAQRLAGAHEKSRKSKRQQDRQRLRAALRSTEKGGDFPPFSVLAFKNSFEAHVVTIWEISSFLFMPSFHSSRLYHKHENHH